MSQLIAFFDEHPIVLKGKAEVSQFPIARASGFQLLTGVVRSLMVYVVVPGVARNLIVPFGEYDEWSLRSRYNEALRIMNVLGAATITCETFVEVTTRSSFRLRIREQSGESTRERRSKSGFDYKHTGTGSPPRDPRPLNWPDEPGFAAAVSSVLENGATEILVRIKSSRLHSIEGSLGVELKGLGFELGGVRQESGTTSLHISATFPRPRRLWK